MEYFKPRMAMLVAMLATAGLAACSGTATDTSSSNDSGYTVPSEPTGLGYTDTATAQDATSVLPFVDYAYTNQRTNPCYVTNSTNAGVRVLNGFLNLWTPYTQIVDAGVTLAASGSCAAVTASSWNGLPYSTYDGTQLNSLTLSASINYVVSATTSRTDDQASAAYYDDRRGKGYSVTDGMGPLTSAWRTAAQQTTTITSIPSDATTTAYSDGGNNIGVGSSSNATLGLAVDFISNIGTNASTEPAKRFYKYARPFRWTSSVVVVPTLVPAESTTPTTDGGFPSGHSAEAMRDAVAMAYLVPERFQEMLERGMELGENRILAGMHSPLDVIGGRILGTANAAGNIYAATSATRLAAYNQTHTALMAASSTTDLTAFNTYAHSGTTSSDRFADHDTNQANYLRRMTFGMTQIADTTKSVVVPKGAEVILETRQPYLSDAQRRVVLKTTAMASGYPVMDDAEGWGRLNLFAAADGYAAFNGDVTVTMDASLGGFNALDYWRNSISGAGLLTKAGTGTLHLTGANTYTGGTDITAGTLAADSTTALGTGAVYLKAGTLLNEASGILSIGGNYTQVGGTLNLALTSATQGTLKVAGTATLSSGALLVSFPGSYTPAVGDTITVLTAGVRNGKFTSITVNGFSNVTATYSTTGLKLYIGG